MEGFSVKCSVLKHSKLEMETLEGKIKNCAEDTGRIRRNLRGKISSEEQIGNRLEQLEERLETHAKELMSFGELAYSMGERYILAEKTILGKDEGWESLDFGDVISKLKGEAGVVGSFATGDIGNIFEATKDIVDAIGEGERVDWFGLMPNEIETGNTIKNTAKEYFAKKSDEFNETVEWFKDPEGIKNRIKDSKFLKKSHENLKEAYEKALKHGDDTTFLKDLTKNAKDAVDDSMKYLDTTDMSQLLGIGGAAVSLYSTGKDNYEEYLQGEISAGRAVAETASELVVDGLLGAGLTIVAASLLPVGAPAVAVGAAVVAAGWALDEVTQWITKDEDTSFTEEISDALLDIAGVAAEGVQNVGDAIGNGIQSAGNAVCDWIGSWF